MFALLADMGYSLPRKDVDADWDERGKEGILKHREDITKRWAVSPFSTYDQCDLHEVAGKHCVKFEG